MSVPALPEPFLQPGPDQGPDPRPAVVATEPSSLSSEARYRALVERVPAITYVISLAEPRGALHVSPQAQAMLGFTPEECMRDPELWTKLLHPDDREREVAAAERHHATGGPYLSEYRVVTRAGETKWFRDEALVVRDEQGRPMYCHGVMVDITERKRAEEELSGRGEILEAVAFAAQRFLSVPTWPDAINAILERLGRAAAVSRIYVFENSTATDGALTTSQAHEWVAEGVRPRPDDPPLRDLRFRDLGFDRWEDTLGSGEIVHGHVREFPERERLELQGQGIRSVLAVPVFVGRSWWGFIGFDQCDAERAWSQAEIDALQTAAGILGATIRREQAEEATRHAEDRYRLLVELSPDAIAVHRQGRLVFANSAAATLVGARTPEEIVGHSVLEFVHPDSRGAVLERLQRLREGKGVPVVAERFVRLDGSPIEVEVAAAPLEHQGEPAVQLVIRDVTERTRSEAVLRERNSYLAALHETTLNVMNRLGLEDALEAIVSRAGDLVGTEHGYIYLVRLEEQRMEVQVGTGAFAGWVGYHMTKGEGMAGRVWETGEALVIDDYDRWSGRSSRFATKVFRAVVGVPLVSGSEVIGVIGLARVEEGRSFSSDEIELLGRFAGLASIALDNARLYTAAREQLVERERAEEELRKAEARYRTLVEQIPAITYTAGFGEEGRWYYVSPQIEPILGYTAERWSDDVGIWGRRLYPTDRDLVLDAEATCRRPGERFHSEYRLLAADGRIVWFRDEARVVEGPAELVMQGVMYDITERKRAEEELERALAREREASERLRMLDEMKNTFLHAVSHELRTPLAAVLGFALTLEREEVQLPPEERRQLLGRLAANARKLEQLLSDLLDLDRLDRGIVEPRRRPTDLAALIRRVVEGSELLGRRPVRVDADLVVASIDGPKVERIVENLLVNAARHTPAGTAIWARVRRTDGGVELTVEDEGPGVAEELRESIFEAFRRGPEASQHSPGVGIGLSLVARFAELHGGRAWVEPRPGGGSRFVVFLPDAPAEEGFPARAGAGGEAKTEVPVLAGPRD